MIKSTIRKRTYRAIYRLLDRVSPVPFDCGMICGAACCNAAHYDEEMGIFLLPGEEKIHDRHADWLTWSTLSTEEYEFPESWHGSVYFVRCKTPPHCLRGMRPIQCRSFPLAPHLTEDGILQLIYNDAELPYKCPMIEDKTELDPRFIRATYTVWKHLIRDPLIYDLVEMESEYRDESSITKILPEEQTVCRVPCEEAPDI
ncbi:MAG: hypothetical protein IJH43_05980 [Mogibacterium sp.]|nr:hypothetical protein [Mogibacterium sp.]